MEKEQAREKLKTLLAKIEDVKKEPKKWEAESGLSLNEIVQGEKEQKEWHLPGYKFCGPGTRVVTRLLRGDKGINELDEGCREHDISYLKDAGDDVALRKSDKRLREIAKKAGGISAYLVDKTFAMKRVAEDMGLVNPSKFAAGLSRKSIPDQRKIGAFLYNRYIKRIN
jgi:hypothetical protein